MSAIAGSADSRNRRADVLRVLKQAPGPMSIADIATRLGVHPNTVRFHLGTLLREGRIEYAVNEDRRPGRPATMVQAVRKMDQAGPRSYQVLAEVLTLAYADGPNPQDRSRKAGRAWGRRLGAATELHGTGRSRGRAAVTKLVDIMDDLGFEPQHTGSDSAPRIGLRHCPFLELAQAQAAVVCPIHLGIMQGALEAWEAPVAVDRLQAFAEPDLCVAHLSASNPAG